MRGSKQLEAKPAAAVQGHHGRSAQLCSAQDRLPDLPPSRDGPGPRGKNNIDFFFPANCVEFGTLEVVARFSGVFSKF